MSVKCLRIFLSIFLNFSTLLDLVNNSYFHSTQFDRGKSKEHDLEISNNSYLFLGGNQTVIDLGGLVLSRYCFKIKKIMRHVFDVFNNHTNMQIQNKIPRAQLHVG